MILVSRANFYECLTKINTALNIAIDTETNGLRVYHGDRLFSIIVSTDENDYYFNYNDNGPTLDRSLIYQIIHPDYEGRIFFHNAKFDLKMLEHEGLNLRHRRIYDTVGLSRIEYNDRLNNTLGVLAKLVKEEKDKSVDEYIKEHKLFTEVRVPSKKAFIKYKHYDQVPFDTTSKYGAMDGNITLKLGHYFLKNIAEQDAGGRSNLKNILQTENKLTPILMQMQDDGIKIDKEYIKEALAYETSEYRKYAKKYEQISGIPFTDSGKNHSKAFTAVGEKFPLTEKGNPSFTDEILESMGSPLATSLQGYRNSYKKAHAYFANFLYIRDGKDIIHAELNQYKARTGRFSSSNPNLQNLKRTSKKEKYPVRKSFVAHENEKLFMLDFNQFEYRMMLNKSGEMGIINQILHDGLDVHTATANLMEKPRQEAKTLNFLLLYGGGLAVLARKLYTTHISEFHLKLIQKYYFFRDFGWSIERISNEMEMEYWEVEHGVEILSKAKELKQVYFSRLPKVKIWVDKVIKQAERGMIYNDFGRAYRFTKNLAFKAPNYKIQGGTADWIKQAMVTIDEYLRPYKTKMLLQVHDELIFGVPNNEEELMFGVQKIMQNVAPTEYLPYTVGIDYSDGSWADKKPYIGE